jgi:UDP-N-acetylmuramyl pentapeptide phosphotransferase/UDP-N-acetylglucosamine-1-phosphate transferase
MLMLKSFLVGFAFFVVFVALYVSFGLRSRLGVPSRAQFGMDVGVIKSMTSYSVSFWAVLLAFLCVGFLVVNFWPHKG